MQLQFVHQDLQARWYGGGGWRGERERSETQERKSKKVNWKGGEEVVSLGESTESVKWRGGGNEAEKHYVCRVTN